MEKLLAALSLPQVGEIKLIPQSEDPEKKEGLFALELNTRVYTLRAKSDAEAILWVNTLTQIRQQGSTTGNRSPLTPDAKQSGKNDTNNANSGQPNGQWDKPPTKCCCCS